MVDSVLQLLQKSRSRSKNTVLIGLDCDSKCTVCQPAVLLCALVLRPLRCFNMNANQLAQLSLLLHSNEHAARCGLPWSKWQFYVSVKIPASSLYSFIDKQYDVSLQLLEGESVFEAGHVFACAVKQHREEQVTLAMGSQT